MGQAVRLAGVEGAIADVMRQTKAEAPEVLRVFAEVALEEIRPGLPKKSGRFAASFRVVPDGQAGVAIESDVPYASQVHLRGEQGPVFQVHIVEYVQQNLPRLAEKTSRRLRGG